MIKSEALIYLVNSMTKPEKKAFRIATDSSDGAYYLQLYDLIDSNKEITSEQLKEEFSIKLPKASFDTSATHLYKTLLNTMLDLRKDQDSYYSLFDMILKARILFEKSLYQECFDTLKKVKKNATKYENYYALLISSRLELEYQLALNFPGLDEKDLLHKHFKVSETLRIIQKIHQQSALYELLKYRMLHRGNARSEKQKTELNDLVVSEMSIVSSSNIQNFEISKLHQLFQANYLISVGDYKSAFHSFNELNNLHEANKHLWSNPPIYYVLSIEGVLDSLRSLREYKGMSHFVQQLEKIDTPFLSFNTNVVCLIFLYELFPFLDRGDFGSCERLMKKYDAKLLKKVQLLSLARNAELHLYLALIYFGLRDFQKAKKCLSKIIFTNRDYSYLPVFRTIRLVNLMILYELKDTEFIKYESRSIKRDINAAGKEYKIEKKIISFVNKTNLPVSIVKRKRLWENLKKDFEIINHDVYEQQTLRLFDFSAWIESKVRRIPLAEILNNRVSQEQ